MIVFHVLHLLTCHFGPVSLFFSIFARATLHGEAAEPALGARLPLNCLRATVGVQCGRRFFMPCFNSLRERIWVVPLAAQVKSPDLVDFPPWKAFTSAFSVFTSPSLFALTATGTNSSSPAGVSPPELEVMFVPQLCLLSGSGVSAHEPHILYHLYAYSVPLPHQPLIHPTSEASTSAFGTLLRRY